MAAPRKTAIRGAIARGESGAKGYKPGGPSRDEPEDVVDPCAPRHVVNRLLARNQAVRHFFSGGMLTSEYCDADPYLLKAARYHGTPASTRCPICKDDGFIHLNYVYGDQLGPYAGRVRSPAELQEMATQYGAFTVYRVEVCVECGWNYLLGTYVLGDGVPRRPPSVPRDLLDQ